MNVRLAMVVAVMSMAAAGCRSPLQKRSPTAIAPLASDVVRAPPLNVDAQAEVGQTLTSSASRRTACPAIKLGGAVVHQATRYPSPFVLTIPQGTLYAAARDPSGTYYAATTPLEFSQGYDGPKSPVRGGVFVPKGSTAGTEVFWLDEGGVALNDDHAGIQFEPVTLPVCDSVTRELVLGAATPQAITLVYRELVGDAKSPALSQELRYDLSRGDVVEARGARLQVVKATETGLTYRVLAYLQE